jgi:CRP-like cAMP-binding protein
MLTANRRPLDCVPLQNQRRNAVNPDTVKSIPLFASVPRRRRNVVASWADEVDVPAGYELTRQGGYAQEFFVVVSGTADVFRDAEHVGALESGDFFGEAGLLGARWEHTATVVATAPMHLLVFARQQFRELLFALPTVAASIRHAADERAHNPGVAVRARSHRELDEVPQQPRGTRKVSVR